MLYIGIVDTLWMMASIAITNEPLVLLRRWAVNRLVNNPAGNVLILHRKSRLLQKLRCTSRSISSTRLLTDLQRRHLVTGLLNLRRTVARVGVLFEYTLRLEKVATISGLAIVAISQYYLFVLIILKRESPGGLMKPTWSPKLPFLILLCRWLLLLFNEWIFVSELITERRRRHHYLSFIGLYQVI